MEAMADELGEKTMADVMEMESEATESVLQAAEGLRDTVTQAEWSVDTLRGALSDARKEAAEIKSALDQQAAQQHQDEAERLKPTDFSRCVWQPEDEREFDDYVQCTECQQL